MRARVPLDVDLEDRLVYGLTPVRLAYVILSLLGGLAIWSSRWAPTPVRATACVTTVVVGASLAWGRWRGRAADRWLSDIAVFAAATHRIVWDRRWILGIRGRLSRSGSAAKRKERSAKAVVAPK